MKKIPVIAIAFSSFLVCSGTASAADVAIDQAYDWSGAYAGLNAGYAWGKTTAFDSNDGNGFPWADTTGEIHAKPDGFVGGAQIGVNYQINQIVLGVEGDIGWLGVSGDGDYDEIPTTQLETDGGVYGTFRGRLGFAVDRLLIFGTGGVIVADLDSRVFDDLNPTILRDVTVGTQVGWTAGAGLEYALSDSWSVKAEYLYYDLGKDQGEALFGATPDPDDIQTFGIKNTGNIVRVGVNWQF